ncbi:MAG: Phosphatidylglycerol--prolipoprotein diacylglyceryl transferase [Candidatus Magasanikbacteria bacterium]|nr:Phosphatidylglycerol--prolipoprotein diacylglyceryl transferase [Candidatus Magasanikbacteria bacterium]
MGARLLDYWFAVIFLIYYGAMRLLLDFFRARDIMGADARYFGLTPGQYAGILMIVGGILLTRFWRRQNRAIK